LIILNDALGDPEYTIGHSLCRCRKAKSLP
jgi:hypothetical protein